MPDIAAIITSGLGNPWLYLPFAVLLGALHALEPGHSKGLMTAYLVAIRGTAAQAVGLGLAAAFGHSLVVWALVLAAFALGRETIETEAYPWLVLVSGLMVLAIAVRLWRALRRGEAHEHDHDHDHDHRDHDHDHSPSCGHSHAPPPPEQAARWGTILWFGLTAGLMPCPSALAVLAVALKMKAFALGVAMVAAFSLGLAIALVGVGVIAAYGLSRAAGAMEGGRFARYAAALPWLSLVLVTVMGLAVTVQGLLLVLR